jgi:hypothetical protein
MDEGPNCLDTPNRCTDILPPLKECSTSTDSMPAAAFAGCLLGYTSDSDRNYPIHTFGMKSNLYGAAFVDDSWKISSQFTVELGIRWDYWFAKNLIRIAGGTFDPALGKAAAGLDSNGQVGNPNLSNPSANLWFNPSALVASSHVASLALMNRFYFIEGKSLQFRWEAFNAFNNTNPADPTPLLDRARPARFSAPGLPA